MGELRLRAWSIKKRKFLNIDTLYCANGKVCAVVDDGVVNDIEDVILEQYTGLKDKNGKEIYEGDIVDFVDDGECIGVVEYDAPEFYLNADATNWGAMYLERTRCQKVIGNIHENPELLERK